MVCSLRDLGFRLDIHEGWFGGRATTTSEFASALGFAGHDVRSLRGIPSAAELRDLPMSVQVAVQVHLRRWAPRPDARADGAGARLARVTTGRAMGRVGHVRPLLVGQRPAPV